MNILFEYQWFHRFLKRHSKVLFASFLEFYLPFFFILDALFKAPLCKQADKRNLHHFINLQHLSRGAEKTLQLLIRQSHNSHLDRAMNIK